MTCAVKRYYPQDKARICQRLLSGLDTYEKYISEGFSREELDSLLDNYAKFGRLGLMTTKKLPKGDPR